MAETYLSFVLGYISFMAILYGAVGFLWIRIHRLENQLKALSKS